MTDLRVLSTTTTSATLIWTAPGEHGATGTATEYDIRYSTFLIDSDSWQSATTVINEPQPRAVGSEEHVSISGLNPNTRYFFALRTRNAIPNDWSPVSNVVDSLTAQLPDTIPPARVADLTVSWASARGSSRSIKVFWSATGDDSLNGSATEYDARCATFPLTPANWNRAIRLPFTGLGQQFRPGTLLVAWADHLAPATTYYLAVRARDDVADHWSLVSNAVVDTTDPPGSWRSLDAGSDYIEDLAVVNGSLYAEDIAQPAHVYMNPGNGEWRAIPSPADPDGNSMLVAYKNQLLWWGDGEDRGHMQAWDGSNWTVVPGGPQWATVKASTVTDDGSLVLGGFF